jgi:hypothetical protein
MRRRHVPAVAALALLALALLLVGCIASGARGSASAAPSSLLVSPAGSDGNPCTHAAPCLTWNRAYNAAKPGQVVEIGAGNYPLQEIKSDFTKTAAADVVFRPAAGAPVSVSGLDVSGSHLTFESFTVEGDWATHNETSDVTFHNLTVHGGIFISSSSGISVIGGSVGGIKDYKPQFGAWPPGTHSTNILVDGVTFHDVNRTDPSIHVECLLVGGGDGITIRNSRFQNCDVFDLSLGEMNGSGPLTNVTIENNFFGGANGYFSVQFNTNSSSLTNVLVRNNSSTQEMYLGNDIPTLTNVRAVGNVAPLHQYSCDKRIAYAYNVWQGARCGRTDANAPARFRSPATGDLHLLAKARAIGHGDPHSFPRRDIDGQLRPQGKRVDAGADERR